MQGAGVPGMSPEAMAAIVALVQTAVAGLAAGQTGPAEPAVSEENVSGGATAPDAAAATLPPTDPVRPATPPRRPRAEQLSRTPKSDASFLNYKSLVDKEYQTESAAASTTMVIFPAEAEKFIVWLKMDPADVKAIASEDIKQYKAILQIRKKYCVKDNPVEAQPPILYRNIATTGSDVTTTKVAVDAYEAFDVIKTAHVWLNHKADVPTKTHLDKDFYGITLKMVAAYIQSCDKCRRQRIRKTPMVRRNFYRIRNKSVDFPFNLQFERQTFDCSRNL